MEGYEKGPVLGTGTFASVFQAVQKETGKVVAIKKIHITDSKEGIHVTALREIALLREIDHPHIIRLMDVFTVKKNILLVLEFMPSDLEAVIKDKSLVLSPANIKSYMQQILSALHACHTRWVVHRDVKPNNCLLARDGTLKLADFGLARHLASPERDPGRPYTSQVFARWYRAPELFFGATSYGFSVDIWAAGCILAELLLRRPWFPGNNDIDQLGRVFQALGTPTEAAWPGVSQLPAYFEFTPVTAPSLRSQFPTASDECLDLLAQCMSLDPRKRPTAEQALKHRWFTSDPLPTHPSQLPRPQKTAAQAQASRAIDATPPPSGSTGPKLDLFARHLDTDEKQARQHEDGDEGVGRSAKRARGNSAPGHASPGMAPDAAGKFSPRPGQTVAS